MLRLAGRTDSRNCIQYFCGPGIGAKLQTNHPQHTRHGHGDGDIDIERKTEAPALIHLTFAHCANGSLSFVRLLRMKQTEVIRFQTEHSAMRKSDVK